jgi:hypothetical protein
MPEIVRFRSRILEIDDDCRERAAEDGVSAIERRLWEAGFSREAAGLASLEIQSQIDAEAKHAKQEPGAAPPDGSGRA